jgi:hypothetical protein
MTTLIWCGIGLALCVLGAWLTSRWGKFMHDIDEEHKRAFDEWVEGKAKK